MNNDFYEAVYVKIELPEKMHSGKLSRILKSLGATLDYDIYSFYRKDEYPEWQSDIYMMLKLSHNNREVDAQDNADSISLDYPMASIGTEYISRFANKAFEISAALDGKVTLEQKVISKTELVDYLDGIAGRLLAEWGEEPGSKNLAIMVENSYKK